MANHPNRNRGKRPPPDLAFHLYRDGVRVAAFAFAEDAAMCATVSGDKVKWGASRWVVWTVSAATAGIGPDEAAAAMFARIGDKQRIEWDRVHGAGSYDRAMRRAQAEGGA